MGWAPKHERVLKRVHNGPSKTSKIPRSLILAPIESAYATSYLVINSNLGPISPRFRDIAGSYLVINSNLGPISPRFRDIAGFLPRRATPSLFHPNFGGVPLGLDCRCRGFEERRPYAILIRVISFELTQHARPRHISVTDG